MDKTQMAVLDFHTKYGSLVNTEPTCLDEKTNLLRYSLILEEISELCAAIRKKNLIEIADALADIRYVVDGTGVAMGVNVISECEPLQTYDINKCWQESSIKELHNFVNLMLEALSAYYEAIKDVRMKGVATSLSQLKTLTDNLANYLSLNLGFIFDEVHASNMTKDGGGADAGGKILKGADYKPPNIGKILREQGWNG